ncbi:MAG TPA: hypothetical protein VGR36_02890 [Candidatus Acidoferrales bacterium]|nr:hypothetical protein [Candidatus Acidoferrales bacterium]
MKKPARGGQAGLFLSDEGVSMNGGVDSSQLTVNRSEDGTRLGGGAVMGVTVAEFTGH